MLDEGTSLIIFFKGFGILETNPIFTMFGFKGYLFALFLFYLFIISAWFWINQLYYKIHKKHYKLWKLYDVFIFIFCVFIIFTTFQKIENGFDNISTIKKISRDELEIINLKNDLSDLKERDNELFLKTQNNVYINNFSMTYLRFWIIIIFSYLLFRSGYRVSFYAYE
jgi:hypothetical protein